MSSLPVTVSLHRTLDLSAGPHGGVRSPCGAHEPRRDCLAGLVYALPRDNVTNLQAVAGGVSARGLTQSAPPSYYFAELIGRV